MLLVALLVVIASLVLKVGDGGAVSVAGRSSLRLPPLCASKAIFGVECPGCGLTRGFVYLAHGRVQESLAVNRVAWVVALALVTTIPYRVAALWTHQARPLGIWVPRIVGWGVLTTLVASWLLRQFGV
jgi:hypothetical protein